MEIRKSQEIAALAKALATFQGEMKAIEKDQTAKVETRTGSSYSYQYADWTSMHEQAKPLLAKYELSLVQHPYEAADGVGLTSMVLHSSGQWLEGSFVLPLPHVKQTKNGPVPLTPQEYGSGITYAKRYGGAAILGLFATDEDDDGAAAQAHARQAPARAAAPRAQAKPPARPSPGPAPAPPGASGAKPAGGPSLGPDGNPTWWASKIGGQGKMKFYSWSQMCDGAEDGARRSWLRWAVRSHKVPTVQAKARWCLEHLGEDVDRMLQEIREETESGDNDSAVVDRSLEDAAFAANDDSGWEPGSNG